MIKSIVRKWKSYRHRFLPWLALNLKHRMIPESVQIDKESKGRLLSKEIENCLKEMLYRFENPCKSVETALIIFGRDTTSRRKLFDACGRKNREILLSDLISKFLKYEQNLFCFIAVEGPWGIIYELRRKVSKRFLRERLRNHR